MSLSEKSRWEYDAPSFVNFASNAHDESSRAEEYFNVDHESQASFGMQLKMSDVELTENFAEDDKNNNIPETFEKSDEIATSSLTENDSEIKEGLRNNVHPSTLPQACCTADAAHPETKLVYSSDENTASETDVKQKVQDETAHVDSLDENTADETDGRQKIEAETTHVDSLDENAETEAEPKMQNTTMPVDSLNENTASEMDAGQKMQEKTMPVDSLDENTASEAEAEQKMCDEMTHVDSLDENIASETDARQNMHDETKPADSLDEDGGGQSDANAEHHMKSCSSPRMAHKETEIDADIEMTAAEDTTVENAAMESQDSVNAQANGTSKPEDMETEPDATSTSTRMVLPNLITPSRAEAWRNAPRHRLNRPRDAKERRSKQLQKAKKLRQSDPVARTVTQEPPNKRPKKKESVKTAPRRLAAANHTRSQSAQRMKSTEERELEQIDMLRYEAKEAMKESQRSLKRALSSCGQAPAISHATPTRPKEFKFKTDERMKSTHGMETRSNASSDGDFAKSLRQHPPSPKKLKPTVVKPFHFANSRKRRMETPSNKPSSKPYAFVPLAKAVVDFQARPRTATNTGTKKGPLKATRLLTAAKTPKLESKKRHRPVTAISAQEMEDKEVEEMKSYHFRAKPANREILEHPHRLPRVERTMSTEPIAFNLKADKRFEDRPKPEEPSTSGQVFKANPVPKQVLEGEHLKAVKVAPATVPQSPAFRLKTRLQMHQKNKENIEMIKAEKEELERLRKQERKPVQGLTGIKKVPLKKPCEQKPFSFDEKDRQRFAKKDEKIQKIIETEKAAAGSFKATPIQFIDTLPTKAARPPTEPKPFHLASDERGAVRAAKWRQEVESEMRQLREVAEFKANTSYSKAIHGKAFQPKIEKKITEVQEFSLHTDERAMQREDFDARQKDRAARAQEEAERVKLELEHEEEKMAEELRKKAVHHAATVRRYKPVLIEKCTKPLTQAHSPQFSDRFYKNT